MRQMHSVTKCPDLVLIFKLSHKIIKYVYVSEKNKIKKSTTI